MKSASGQLLFVTACGHTAFGQKWCLNNLAAFGQFFCLAKYGEMCFGRVQDLDVFKIWMWCECLVWVLVSPLSWSPSLLGLLPVLLRLSLFVLVCPQFSPDRPPSRTALPLGPPGTPENSKRAHPFGPIFLGSGPHPSGPHPLPSHTHPHNVAKCGLTKFGS